MAVFLGYPSQKIKEDIIDTYYLFITATNGNISKIPFSKIPQPLAYCDSNIQVLSPFKEDQNLSAYNSVVSVNDKKGNILSIGDYAFNGCTNLSSINCPNVTTIGDRAFFECYNLPSVNCPNAISIGNFTFDSCTGLTSINCPNVSSIGTAAFLSCTNLFSINCPNLMFIYFATFWKCTNLYSINCPNVRIIAGNAFSECPNLTSVNFPNVTSIGNSAFTQCSNLSSISMSSITSVPILRNTNAFSQTPDGISCYVPSALCADFYTADNWSDLLAQESPKFKMIGI